MHYLEAQELSRPQSEPASSYSSPTFQEYHLVLEQKVRSQLFEPRDPPSRISKIFVQIKGTESVISNGPSYIQKVEFLIHNGTL